ncbi:MAG: hypothetical protein HY822_18265 [Acidobacteria bacterium]|nr:hypothetical protein [Acidobacteriota bacterium]
MRRRESERLGRRCERLLGLDKWETDYRFASQADLKGEAGGFFHFGRSYPHLETQTARVLIARECDIAAFVNDRPTQRVILLALLHELEHILLDPASRLPNDAVFEVGLDKIAEALATCL